MKGLRSVLAAGLLVAVVAACGDAPEAGDEMTTPSAPAWVDSVATVANALEARPSAADSILGAHGMRRARLDSLLYEIAADPALTEAYQAARTR